MTPVLRPATPADADPIPDGVVLTGLAAVRARDPDFDIGRFLGGA